MSAVFTVSLGVNFACGEQSITFLQYTTEVYVHLFFGTRLSLSVTIAAGVRTAPLYSNQATSPTMEESRFDSRRDKIYLLSKVSRYR